MNRLDSAAARSRRPSYYRRRARAKEISFIAASGRATDSFGLASRGELNRYLHTNLNRFSVTRRDL